VIPPASNPLLYFLPKLNKSRYEAAEREKKTSPKAS
jgi:hypothetical protein